MKISEFVDKYRTELNITYSTVYRLIKECVLQENIHYRISRRGSYEKYTVLEKMLYKFFKGEK